MLFRYTSAVLLGTVATFGLLTLMRSVIADPLPAEDSGIKGDLLIWTRIVEERDIVIDPPRPKPPPPPDEPPPPLPRENVFEGPTIGGWGRAGTADSRPRRLRQPLPRRWQLPAHRQGESDLPAPGAYEGHRGIRPRGIRRYGNRGGSPIPSCCSPTRQASSNALR